MAAPRRIAVGRLIGPHGVRGLMRLESYTAEPDAIVHLERLATEGGTPVRLTLVGSVRGALLVRIEGVTSRDAAEDLRGRTLYVPREALPATAPDEYYEADLVGLAMMEGRRRLGRVVSVADFGAGPLLEVAPENGCATVYVPFTAEVVGTVDLDRGTIAVTLPDGLWPEDR